MFILKFIKSFAFACKGFLHLLKFETNFKIQFSIGCISICLGFYFDISILEWMIQLLAIALVLSIEAINTSIEKIANYIQPNFDHKIALLKDIAASASLIASFFTLIVGLLIYIPKIQLLF